MIHEDTIRFVDISGENKSVPCFLCEYTPDNHNIDKLHIHKRGI